MLSSHGLIHSPGPRAHCFIQGHPMCSTALQDVKQNNRRTVCVCLDCPAYCPASVLPATYCPAKVLQAWPSHDWVLLLVGLRVLLDQITRAPHMASGLLALLRSPPNPCNSGNLRPHKQNKSSLLLKWSRSRQLQGSIKFSHTEYIQAFIPTHFEY